MGWLGKAWCRQAGAPQAQRSAGKHAARLAASSAHVAHMWRPLHSAQHSAEVHEARCVSLGDVAFFDSPCLLDRRGVGGVGEHEVQVVRACCKGQHLSAKLVRVGGVGNTAPID